MLSLYARGGDFVVFIWCLKVHIMLAEDISILYIGPEDIKCSVCAVPRELVPGVISKRHTVLNRQSGVEARSIWKFYEAESLWFKYIQIRTYCSSSIVKPNVMNSVGPFSQPAAGVLLCCNSCCSKVFRTSEMDGVAK